ncbi:tellurite resistance TerB family protein [Flocculibacter collagenilyticus]|uniref:tellurite resistance TerB family protein n=1 Tax=Flocculibacter collagenilyticus TaxID=2744479 RepID=UPI0018F5FA6C|nr:TerB family tellurite resistance protein [Flocculibacter collagenilyticus]
MLNALKQLLVGKENTQPEPKHRRELAAAALLFEVAKADDDKQVTEERVLKELLQKRFNLSHEELNIICEQAENTADTATDYYQFTREINDHYSHAEKVELTKLMWQVAYADGHLDPHEEHLIRRVADLLHVRHSEFLQTKHHVSEQCNK